MKGISIHVENGKITGVAPAGLPDGDFELAFVEPADELSEDELARVEAMLHRGVQAAQRGETQDAGVLAARLLRG